jgi:hypothetical protein
MASFGNPSLSLPTADYTVPLLSLLSSADQNAVREEKRAPNEPNYVPHGFAQSLLAPSEPSPAVPDMMVVGEKIASEKEASMHAHDTTMEEPPVKDTCELRVTEQESAEQDLPVEETAMEGAAGRETRVEGAREEDPPAYKKRKFDDLTTSAEGSRHSPSPGSSSTLPAAMDKENTLPGDYECKVKAVARKKRRRGDADLSITINERHHLAAGSRRTRHQRAVTPAMATPVLEIPNSTDESGSPIESPDTTFAVRQDLHVEKVTGNDRGKGKQPAQSERSLVVKSPIAQLSVSPDLKTNMNSSSNSASAASEVSTRGRPLSAKPASESDVKQEYIDPTYNNFRFQHGNLRTGRSARDLDNLLNPPHILPEEPASQYMIPLSYRRFGVRPADGLVDRLVLKMEKEEAKYQRILRLDGGLPELSDSPHEDEDE